MNYKDPQDLQIYKDVYDKGPYGYWCLVNETGLWDPRKKGKAD
jgi:hypothetical protein